MMRCCYRTWVYIGWSICAYIGWSISVCIDYLIYSCRCINYSDVLSWLVSCEWTHAGLTYNDRDAFRACAHPFSVKRYWISSGAGNTSTCSKRSKSLLRSCNIISMKDANFHGVVVVIVVVVAGVIPIVIIKKYRLVFKYSSRHSVAVYFNCAFRSFFLYCYVLCKSHGNYQRRARK